MATLLSALSTSLWLSLAAFDMISMVIRGSLVQLDTPDPMRGRVSAVPATLVWGIGTLLVVAVWMGLFPTLRRRQRLEADG